MIAAAAVAGGACCGGKDKDEGDKKPNVTDTPKPFPGPRSSGEDRSPPATQPQGPDPGRAEQEQYVRM